MCVCVCVCVCVNVGLIKGQSFNLNKRGFSGDSLLGPYGFSGRTGTHSHPHTHTTTTQTQRNTHAQNSLTPTHPQPHVYAFSCVSLAYWRKVAMLCTCSAASCKACSILSERAGPGALLSYLFCNRFIVLRQLFPPPPPFSPLCARLLAKHTRRAQQ